jgi:hypothetical protein
LEKEKADLRKQISELAEEVGEQEPMPEEVPIFLDSRIRSLGVVGIWHPG